MKHLLFFCLYFLSLSVFAQNLVNNPSFETGTCPTTYGQLNLASGWTSYGGSVDYLATCGSASVGVPSNFFGNEPAATGNRYCGLLTYHSSAARELAGTQLSAPLITGQTYYVSFKVSVGEAYSQYATNNLGVQFNATATAAVNNTSQFYTTSVISGNSGWQQISGSFVAPAAYQYMAVGNFFTDALTTKVVVNAVSFQAGYYFVDDVCLSLTPGTCFVALPITWKKVQAESLLGTSDIGIRWEMEDMTNIKQFFVEHSTDGQVFERIDTIEANSQHTVWSTVHQQVSQQPHFYSIRAIDKDGNTHLSKQVEVLPNNEVPALFVYPNPSAPETYLTLKSAVLQEQATIRIYAITGALIREETQTVSANSQQVNILTPQEKGVYLLTLISKGKQVQQKLVVE